MHFIKQIRVGKERFAAGFCAEINRPSAINGAWKILRVGVAENPSAQGYEAMAMMFSQAIFLQHGFILLPL